MSAAAAGSPQLPGARQGMPSRDSRDRDSWDAHPSAPSQSHLAGRKDEVWPFRRGRIIPCR